jgi:hypothetical protein
LLAPFAATQEFDHDPIAKTMTTCDMTCCPILGISGSCRAMIVPFSVSPQKTAAGVYCQVDRVFLNKQFFDSHYLQVSIVNAGNHAGTARLPPLDSEFRQVATAGMPDASADDGDRPLLQGGRWKRQLVADDAPIGFE